MTTQSTLQHYAVMGNPIAHSKSPLIHAAFAHQTEQLIDYQAILVDTAPGAFQTAVQQFQAQGGCGLNVTVPFKQEAWQLATQRTPRAERAGAVNTLWFSEGKIHGDTTDGAGLVRDMLENHRGKFAQQRVLILGAGGAVRGVLEPILAEKPSCCVIANRTVAKAQALADIFALFGTVSGCAYGELQGQHFDVVINGTSASLQGEMPPLPADLLAENAWCYDMMYAKTATIFMRWAQQHGAVRTLDGLGMLVEQAAESFFIWRGVRPKTATVIERLRASFVE